MALLPLLPDTNREGSHRAAPAPRAPTTSPAGHELIIVSAEPLPPGAQPECLPPNTHAGISPVISGAVTPRAVEAIEGIDVAAAKDQAELRQQLQDTRAQVCKLIDELLDSIQPTTLAVTIYDS